MFESNEPQFATYLLKVMKDLFTKRNGYNLVFVFM